MTQSVQPPSSSQSCKPQHAVTFFPFDINHLWSASRQIDFNNCSILQIGTFVRFAPESIRHFALNIRHKRDARPEMRALTETVSGDGALIVSTPLHVSIIVPPFSELAIFTFQNDRNTVLFDSIEGFLSFSAQNKLPLEIDAVRIAQYLVSDQIHNRRTAFRDLKEVEHGCSITAFRNDPDPALLRFDHMPDIVAHPIDPSIQNKDAMDAVRGLLREAIECKANTANAGISLSGGFDSSLVAASYVSAHPKATLSLYHLYSSSNDELVEIAYANAVRERFAHKIKWLDLDHVSDLTLELPRLAIDFRPQFLSGWYERNLMIYEAAKADNIDILLSGDGGDELMLPIDNYPLSPELIGEGFPVMRAITVEAILKEESAWKVVYDWLSGLSAKYMNNWFNSTRATGSMVQFVLPVHDDEIDILENLHLYGDMSLSQLFQYVALRDARYSTIAASVGVCERRPFLYWPLVRYCLSCPRSVMIYGGQERGLFRHAFTDILPRSITNRMLKAGDSDVSSFFDFEILMKRICASPRLDPYLDKERMLTIDIDRMDFDQAVFLMRCATVDAYLDLISARAEHV